MATAVICPSCEKGTLRKGITREYFHEIYLGEFSAEICGACGESFTDSITTRYIQDAAKKKGLWGKPRLFSQE